jgi:preprotein translocase subunit SecF
MLVYLTIRFKFEYGLGAVICLLHDTLLILGFTSIAHLQFDMTLVAGLLTFMGYTVNDTIVIYDRIRENHEIMKDDKLINIFNTSTNQCLTRSLITSFTTLLAVIALFLFAGEKLRGFSTIMIVGIVVGTYSSLFIASPLVYLFKKFFTKKGKDERKAEEKKAETKNSDNDTDEQKTEVTKNPGDTIVLSKKQQKKLESMKNGD